VTLFFRLAGNTFALPQFSAPAVHKLFRDFAKRGALVKCRIIFGKTTRNGGDSHNRLVAFIIAASASV